MNIFISWSGSQSKLVANKLRQWIPLILHYAKPWVSDFDINAGERWTSKIGAQLESCNFGIICITKANVNAPWVLFESGALSKSIENSNVCPYMIDSEFADITSSPLGQFQAKKSNKESTLELLKSINSASSIKVSEANIETLFEHLWSDLEETIREANEIASSEKDRTPEQSLTEREMLDNIIETIFENQRILQNIARQDSLKVVNKETEVIQILMLYTNEPKSRILDVVFPSYMSPRKVKIIFSDDNTVSEILDAIYILYLSNVVPSYTYNTNWVLENERGEVVFADHIKYGDTRQITESKIKNGASLFVKVLNV